MLVYGYYGDGGVHMNMRLFEYFEESGMSFEDIERGWGKEVLKKYKKWMSK